MTDRVENDDGGSDKAKRRARGATIFAWVRNIAVILVLFAAWQLWGTAVVQHHYQTELAGQFHTDTATSPHDDAPFGLLPSTSKVAGRGQGSVIAQIQIPAIGVDQFVVDGTTGGNLEKGPGHYMGTARPGQAGNVAIAGHRTTFGAPFDRLNQLRGGELVVLTSSTGVRLRYAVSGTPRVLSASDDSVLNDFGDDRLTLLTSTPTYYGAQNLVVVALLTQPPPGASTTPPPTPGPPPGPLTDTHTAGWNLRQLPFVALIVALLVLLGLVSRPSRRRRVVTVLTLGPVWIVGLYLLFLTLTNVLPSTL